MAKKPTTIELLGHLFYFKMKEKKLTPSEAFDVSRIMLNKVICTRMEGD